VISVLLVISATRALQESQATSALLAISALLVILATRAKQV
jgi:hypothetical protein